MPVVQLLRKKPCPVQSRVPSVPGYSDISPCFHQSSFTTWYYFVCLLIISHTWERSLSCGFVVFFIFPLWVHFPFSWSIAFKSFFSEYDSSSPSLSFSVLTGRLAGYKILDWQLFYPPQTFESSVYLLFLLLLLRILLGAPGWFIQKSEWLVISRSLVQAPRWV